MAEQKRGGPRGHGPQGHGFQRPKDFRGTVSKLLRYIGRYKAALVVVFICLVISSVGSVMSSYLLKPIINDYILVGDFAGLLKMLALLLGLFLLSGLCSYAYARIMVHISQRTVAQMRQDLFDKLQDLPLRYFDTHQSGDLMSRFTNDMDTVSEMINSSFASVVSCALTFIGIVVMMLYMNWVLTLITFAFLVLMLLVVKGVGGRSRVSFQAQQQALGAMNGYIEEMVEGQKVIKVFNHESKAIAQFSGLNDSYRDAATAAQTYSGAMMPAMANLSRIDYAVTCCVGGLLAIARAAGSDPPVLILDEATSSIDTRTENLIEQGMDSLMEGRTVVVIAHRLSTVRNSQAILVLEHGRIIERGDHQELLAQKGKYYQLYTGKAELS